MCLIIRMEERDLYSSGGELYNGISFNERLVRAYMLNKVSLQISLERNFSNSLYIFILGMNFENLTVKLHVLIISFMLAKFVRISSFFVI